jgi:signal recognition particle subunit SRP54
MLVGLFGSGKTTTAGKLAKYYSKRGKKICMVGLDVWRPAAMKQLEQNAKLAKVDYHIDIKEKDPVKIWNSFKDKEKNYDLIIVDTAGRDALSDELIEEIELITKTVEATEKLLIISGDIGQTAEKQASQFHKSCGITGIIVTKMEGTAKGGGALTACAVTEAPIKFLGVGEKQDDLETFNPEGFVSRLLGMGDIEALLEKAQEAMNEEDAQDLGKKLMKGEFNLIDLYEQMKAMSKMGSMSKIMSMIPGMGSMKMPKEVLDVQEGKMEKWKHVMDSCTKEELEDPEKVMTADRISRIAKGCGLEETDVRDLLKHYKKSKKFIKGFGGSEKKMQQMMKNMGGMPGMK